MNNKTERTMPNEFLPDFLSDYAAMITHLNEQAEKLGSNKAKGEFFEKITSEIIAEYPDIDLPIASMNSSLTQSSWEEGIDIVFSSDNDKDALYVQVKWSIKGIDDIDEILSKFNAYYRKNHDIENEVDRQGSLFDSSFEFLTRENLENESNPKIEFMIVTLKRDCQKILERYEKSDRPSTEFYQYLKSKGAFHLIDGERVFELLRANLFRFCGWLPDIELSFINPPISIDNVQIGVVSCKEILSCYKQVGESIFFENVRLFKGEDSGKKQQGRNREPVNTEIIRTLIDEPGRMLSRNNGITIRAEQVKISKDSPEKLMLSKASIVNGCQTTRCVASALETTPENGEKAMVLVKVVETTSSWDIAEAANFQNRINQIDLKLARYLRPQVAIRAGMSSSISVDFEGSSSAYEVLNKMSLLRTGYEDVKSLFIGLFSRSPSNATARNYTELNYPLLDQFLEENQENNAVLELILEVQSRSDLISEEISRKLRPQSFDLFKRFFQRGGYKAFLTITAGCVLAENNLYKAGSKIEDLIRMLELLRDCTVTDSVNSYMASFLPLSTMSVKVNRSREENLKAMFGEVSKITTGEEFNNLVELALEQYSLIKPRLQDNDAE